MMTTATFENEIINKKYDKKLRATEDGSICFEAKRRCHQKRDYVYVEQLDTVTIICIKLIHSMHVTSDVKILFE